jgi:hypothetical protein
VQCTLKQKKQIGWVLCTKIEAAGTLDGGSFDQIAEP